MPPILGWSRPLGEVKYHGVIALDASAHTACSGRWSRREPAEFLEGRDRDVDHAGNVIAKCAACEAAARNERIEECLAELAAAPAIVGCDVNAHGPVLLECRTGYGITLIDFRSSIRGWDL